MKIRTKFSLILLFLIGCQLIGVGQIIPEDEKYVPETNPFVLKKLGQWQDIKFGLLMHWGTYSQWGIVESWSICPEEYDWCKREAGTNPGDYFAYKKEYEALKNTFNPMLFNPEKWARAAKDAGMKYVVFTTKHHDGFCMFDSQFTDYKVTDPACPFSASTRKNIAKEIFNAFRDNGLWVGAYFSKPDWHSPDYWDPAYPPRDRNVNYEPEANPEKWDRFTTFTHNQILELLSDYGPIDILWLDGGWVRKTPKADILNWYDEELKANDNGYLPRRIVNQDIRMDELVVKAREIQPDLIVVDRAVPGKNQNYLTPENRVPAKPLPYPWESCITAGQSWSYLKNASYISGKEGVQLLVDIVAKGGNLLLNIAPGPDGEWHQDAYDLLTEYGDWMKVNGEGIYQSKVLEPYKEANICMTRQTNGNAFFFYLAAANETRIPSKINITSHQPAKGAIVTLLGSNKSLHWETNGKGFTIHVPKDLQNHPPCNYVWTFRVTQLQPNDQ
ncbi:MAG: alpha-L-fucosidase [Bacteroidetes bacterium]|nr:alpha-L-fucosidase [Bacteroidota bacterium]